MATFDLGDVVRLDFTVKVDGVLTAPSTIALSVRDPAGVITAYTPVLDAVGTYHYDFVPTLAGGHIARWVTTGTGQTAEEQPFEVVAAYSRLVSLAQVKTHLGLTTVANDAELYLLIDAATPIIEELAGPVVQRTVTETLTGSAPHVLSASHVVSVTSVTRDAVVITPTTYTLAAGGLLTGFGLAGATITYIAGRATVPPNIQRAALRWISWSWRRDHGGSESYMPAGDDAVPGLGVRGIEQEITHILGPDRRGMRVG